MKKSQLIVATCCLFAQAAFGQAEGCDIVVINRGFEDPVLVDNEYSYFIPGWVVTGDSGAFNPGVQTYPDGVVVQGRNCGYVSCCTDGRQPGVMSQTLPALLLPNTTYELSLWVGQRLETPWSDMRLQLVAGETSMIDVVINNPPMPGTFSQRTFRVDVPPIHAAIGTRLQIRMSHENGLEHQANYDDFRLVAQPICTTICGQPASVRTCHGVTTEFNVIHAGIGPFLYQWTKDEVPLTNGSTSWGSVINGADSFRLVINDVHPSDNGVYALSITDGCGKVWSENASLLVCRSDFNCDGLVDLFDYLDFVDAFASQAISADWNEDGIIDFFDYLDFVNQMSTGC